jgi:chemotaxis protein CheD
MTIQPARLTGYDVFLKPGEFYFGGSGASVATVLGSCVSLTLWHPRLRIGGMCHYLLPARCGGGEPHQAGTYADEAMARHGTRPPEYQAKMFGGANMFPAIQAPPSRDVGARNIAAGRELLQVFGIALVGEHVGGTGHRRVLFDLASGDVWVKQVSEAMVPNWAALTLPDFGSGGA